MDTLEKEWGPMLKQAAVITRYTIKQRCEELDVELSVKFRDAVVQDLLERAPAMIKGSEKAWASWGGHTQRVTIGIPVPGSRLGANRFEVDLYPFSFRALEGDSHSWVGVRGGVGPGKRVPVDLWITPPLLGHSILREVMKLGGLA